MTQCERVLSMLRSAGKRGVRSDEFFRVGLPRGVARIWDLRQRGYEIEDEPEGKYKRFRLVGVGAGQEPQPASLASADSGERSTGGRGRAEVASGAARSVPGFFDVDADWNAP